MKIGYARVSTREQNLDLQIQALEESGCELIFKEKISGVADKRPELEKCLDHLRKGDVLVVYKLDRLGRSLRSILWTIDRLKKNDIAFVSLNDNISTLGPAGELMANIIGACAQFERDIIVERCKDGRRIAKEKGVKFGRPPKKVNNKNTEKVDSCAKLYLAGSSVSSIKKALAIGSYETIYRFLALKGISPSRSRFRKK